MTPHGFRRDAVGYFIQKDPQSVLYYVVDWADWLDGDAISSAAFTVAGGLTKASESNTTTTATVWLSGGTLAASYLVTCQIVTTGGRTAERSFRVVMVAQ